MGINTAIILAGGLGTRLQAAVPGLPKCMAPVNGRPFIDYIIDYLRKQGITHYILALGFRAEAVQYYLINSGLANVQFSLEQTPLGTGGAIKKAAAFTQQENVLVVNGDTLFTANIATALALHLQRRAECTLSLKPMANFSRFGTVIIDEDQQVRGFREKQPTVAGLINGGVYILNLKKWLQHTWPEAFSFESDYLAKKYLTSTLVGTVQEGYFIDIGVPEDYKRAQVECKLS